MRGVNKVLDDPCPSSIGGIQYGRKFYHEVSVTVNLFDYSKCVLIKEWFRCWI